MTMGTTGGDGLSARPGSRDELNAVDRSAVMDSSERSKSLLLSVASIVFAYLLPWMTSAF